MRLSGGDGDDDHDDGMIIMENLVQFSNIVILLGYFWDGANAAIRNN